MWPNLWTTTAMNLVSAVRKCRCGTASVGPSSLTKQIPCHHPTKKKNPANQKPVPPVTITIPPLLPTHSSPTLGSGVGLIVPTARILSCALFKRKSKAVEIVKNLIPTPTSSLQKVERRSETGELLIGKNQYHPRKINLSCPSRRD